MRAIATVLNDGIVVLTLLHQGEFHVILDPRERWSPDGGEREAEPRHDVAAVEVVRGAERVWRRGAAQPDTLRLRPRCNEAVSLSEQRRLFLEWWGAGPALPRAA